MTVENSHFYGTHGISIGSQTQFGVTNILVANNTVSGTDSAGNVSTDNNGLRIKTTRATAARSTGYYDSNCMTGVKHPMEFDPFYSSGNGSTTPYYKNIVVNGLKSVSSAVQRAVRARGLQLHLSARADAGERQPRRDSTSPSTPTSAPTTPTSPPSGTDVTVTAISGSGSVPSCTFPSYPGL